MAVEIERKFLVASKGWRRAVRSSERLVQGYIARGPHHSVRVRASETRALLTIKSTTAGLIRTEFEYDIPLSDARQLLGEACAAPLIEKVRHQVTWAGAAWIVDEFEGRLAGLLLAEIELASADQPIDPPPWLGAEVTHDPAYRNDNLALAAPDA